MHQPHHDPQKSRMTYLPRRLDRVRDLPLRSFSVKSGAISEEESVVWRLESVEMSVVGVFSLLTPLSSLLELLPAQLLKAITANVMLRIYFFILFTSYFTTIFLALSPSFTI